MDEKAKSGGPLATRRNVLAGLAGVGATAAVLSTAKAQGRSAPAKSGPILFKRTAETERYYKTLLK